MHNKMHKRRQPSASLSHCKKRPEWMKQKPRRQDTETAKDKRDGKIRDTSRVEPIYTALPKLRPPSYNATKKKASTSFSFEEDVQPSDDSMDGSLLSDDPGDNIYRYDNPDTGLYWPVEQPTLWPAKGWIPHSERNEDIQDWILSVKERNGSRHVFDPVTERRPLLAQIRNQEEADLYSNSSSRNDYSDLSDNTTLPVIDYEDNDCNAALEADRSPVLVRQGSVELGATPRSNRSYQSISATGGSPTVTWQRASAIHDVKKSQPLQQVLPEQQARLVQQTQQPRRQIRAEREKTFIGNRQLSPLLVTGPSTVESAQLDELGASENESVQTTESDSSVKHTISEAILDLHRSMCKPFWTNDERWLVSVTLPALRSHIFTPMCDEIIKWATELIQIIEWIKSKETCLERSRFATAMSRRISNSVRKIRVSCDTICRDTLKMDKEDSTATTIKCHEQMFKRIRECLVPRLVVLIAKTFTLLADPGRMMRQICMSLMQDICFDLHRIANIIESAVENSYMSEPTTDIEEFIHVLSFVRGWVRSEMDQT